MGRLVEVLEVEAADVAEGGPLRGANVDSPTAGRGMAAAAIEIGGWALAEDGPPEAIEVAHEGKVLGEGVRQDRDDLEQAFPDVAGATQAGFALELDGGGLPAECELTVQARVEGAATPLARLQLRRYWRGALASEAPLISLLVIGGREDEAALQRSLDSLARQRHPFTETAAWNDPSLGPVELRNEAIRRSNGGLLLFLPAGAALAPDALALAVGMLGRQPQASAVVDGDEEGIGAAIYRRSAFEELGGFDPDAAEAPDLELAQRARELDALFAPGALVGGGG